MLPIISEDSRQEKQKTLFRRDFYTPTQTEARHTEHAAYSC